MTKKHPLEVPNEPTVATASVEGGKTVTIKWEPAIFPLSAIQIDPPLLVKALNNRNGLTKGAQYYIGGVHMTGKVMVIGGSQPHDMDSFVQLLHGRRSDGAD